MFVEECAPGEAGKGSLCGRLLYQCTDPVFVLSSCCEALPIRTYNLRKTGRLQLMSPKGARQDVPDATLLSTGL
jgi:hypothetical protein